MKISFLITTHNEDKELDILLEQLTEYLKDNPEDEIVVLDDCSDNPNTLELFKKYKDSIDLVKNRLDPMGGGFAEQKNFGNSCCSGDYIFQIDSDEYFTEDLLYGLKTLIAENPAVDLFLVPRINILRNITVNKAAPWGWHISKFDGFEDTDVYHDNSEEYAFLKQYDFIKKEKRISDNQMEVTYELPVINFPDPQHRFYRKADHIRWDKPLHEDIVGAELKTLIPPDPNWCLIHDKTMEKQEKQNRFYMDNFSEGLNRGMRE